MFTDPKVQHLLARHPHPFLFVTVSGAHLYGFESPDSDVDLRGCHTVRAIDTFTIDGFGETIEVMDKEPPLEVDLVTHDAAKYFRLLLNKNGYVLEQIFSPLVIVTTPEHEELKAIAITCLTKHHRHHYRGFSANQWEMVVKNAKPTVKGVLYTFRVLLAGIHLLRTGHVEANLRTLNREARLPYIDDLIARKIAGTEKGLIGQAELAGHQREFDRLNVELDLAAEASPLPEQPTGRPALEDLLKRLRLKTLEAG